MAVRRIVWYLKATSDEGYSITPSEVKRLDCYVDADFAGLWDPEMSEDPNSVKSRTGYVIMFANAPIIWVSKLQTEIALSTTEAEYIAMLQSMRDLLPMQRLLKELGDVCGMTIDKSVTHSKCFEDNQGCEQLANAPKMRPRTKHIAIKNHHFREHVSKGTIKIEWISTDKQLADIFTKPLAKELFERLRIQLLGW